LAGRIIRLEEKSPGMGEERYALESDLTWLFGDYEEIKREIRVYDEDDILSSVRSYLKNDGIPHILANMDILFYFFHQAEEVWWLLDYDSQCKDPIGDFKEAAGREAKWHWVGKGRSRGHEQLGRHEAYQVFTSLVSLMERLDRTGFDSCIEKATEEPFRNPVAGGLYSHGHMDESSGESLKIRSFANRADEVRAIAGEIKRIIRDNKLDPCRDLGKMRVIFPDLKDYSSLIFEIFSEFLICWGFRRILSSLKKYPAQKLL
jgi:hypothetical protein